MNSTYTPCMLNDNILVYVDHSTVVALYFNTIILTKTFIEHTRTPFIVVVIVVGYKDSS